MFINKGSREPIHPAILMASFWGIICLVYFFGPIYLTPKVSFSTFMFLALHVLLFILGSTFLIHITFFKNLTTELKIFSYMPNRYLYHITGVVLVVGICGGLMSIYSKIAVLGTINLSSISELRTMRAQALLAGGTVQSGLMSALAFLMYPAGFIGVVASMIFYEKIPSLIKIMSYFFMLNIVLFSVFLGGRSPILVLFLFIGAAFYVRGQIGISYIPKSQFLRVTSISTIILFVIYSSYIWIIRAKESGMLSTNAVLDHAANVWGAHPKPYLLAAGDWLGDPGYVQTVLSSTFYFIQNLSISERLLFAWDEIPTMFGTYQIDLFAALFRVFPEGAEFLKNGYGVLLNANVYGFFTGAWSGLYLDLWVFSFLAAAIWGALAGKSWFNFKKNPNLLTGIKYIFWSYSIFISFVSSPFGFSNSFMIFIWFSLFSIAALLFTRYKIISLT